MPTSKQLRSAAKALRGVANDTAAGHLATHADVIDKGKAHTVLDRHVADLSVDDLAQFNRGDVLDAEQLRLVSAQINVAPLLSIEPQLAGGTDADRNARQLLGLPDPAGQTGDRGTAPEAHASAHTEALNRLAAATEAHTSALLQTLPAAAAS